LTDGGIEGLDYAISGVKGRRNHHQTVVGLDKDLDRLNLGYLNE
jgi:hypothetical protein